MTRYSILDHTADTGIEARAESLTQLIAALAEGMFGLMTGMEPCPSSRSVELEISANTEEDLVFEALSELLYRSEVEDLLFCEFRIEVKGERNLVIVAHGVPAEQTELAGPPIKAVTYHGLEIVPEDGGWYGKVYFDV